MDDVSEFPALRRELLTPPDIGRLEPAKRAAHRPRELPVANSVPADHPKVQELRALSLWSEAQVWCSPELHGAIRPHRS